MKRQYNCTHMKEMNRHFDICECKMFSVKQFGRKNERKKQKQGKDEEKRDRNGKILISPLSTQILRGDTFYSPTSPKRNSVPPRRCPWNCTNILFLLTERGKVSLLWCHSALLAVDPDCSHKGVDVFLPPMPRTLKWGGKLGLSVPMDCWCYGERCTLSHSVEQCYTAHWSWDTLEVVRTLGTYMVWFEFLGLCGKGFQNHWGYAHSYCVCVCVYVCVFVWKSENENLWTSEWHNSQHCGPSPTLGAPSWNVNDSH